MIDITSPPLELANTIFNKTVEKVDSSHALEMIEKYFEIFHSHEKKDLDIGKELTLIASIAEVYTNDPIYVLFQCGIVVFSEITCLKISKLHHILSASQYRIQNSISKSNFLEFANLPESFNETLFRLGYLDSTDWNIFYIPQKNPFAIHILKHKIFVQTFPAELVDILSSSITAFTELYARREKIIANVTSESEAEPKEKIIQKRHSYKGMQKMIEENSANENMSQDETSLRRSERIKEKGGTQSFTKENSEYSDYSYEEDYTNDYTDEDQ